MKKLLMLMAVLLVFVMLGACREKTATGETTEPAATGSADATSNTGAETTSSTSDTATEQTSTGSDATTTESVSSTDPDAGEETFVQTGTYTDNVKIGVTSSDPSLIVVDHGDLVTLTITSERLKPTEIYNADLHVDTNVDRAKTVTVSIQANENGYFNITDQNTNDLLFKIVVAQQNLKGNETS